jgi:hypothetical protein
MAINKIQSSNSKNFLQFKALPKLEFKFDNQKGFVKYGKDNLYPSELVRLYNEHPEHRAIINRKARYMSGKGLKAAKPEDEMKVNAFIESFNRKDDLNKVLKKITPNTELFNGLYIEVITDLLGKPIEMYFLNSANCRVNEDCSKLYFCKNWTRNTNLNDVKIIDKFNEKDGKAGTFFIEFKYYTPSATYIDSVYPTAQYQSIVDDINTDVDISTFNKNYVNNGFSVGKMITFYSGTPPDPMKQEIDRRFKGTYTGEEGENVLISFVDRDDKEPTVTDISIADLSEKFAFTSKRAQKKIFAGHEMASELFNIKFDDSFLTGAPDLLTLQELFVKGYIEPRQEDLLEFLSYLAYLKTGEYLEMIIEPISLIGADLSQDVDLTQDERRKLKGYAPLKAVPLDTNGEPLPVQASEVNDALVGLSATERNDINRIVHHFKTKKNGTSEALAIASLGAYGFSVSDAKKFLGINEGLDAKMSSQNSVDAILMAFESVGTIEDPSTYTVLKREKVKFRSQVDALKYERQVMKFADALIVSIEDLDSAVLNALKGNPTMTIEELAASLKQEIYSITDSIGRLVDKNLLIDSVSGFTPTNKAIEETTEPIVSNEIYTIYKYEVNDEKPSLVKGGSSRPFCKKLISLNREYTFEQIDGIRLEGMENVAGSNIWDFRGGYYTNPSTGVIDPDCRHIWVAETRLRKKK